MERLTWRVNGEARIMLNSIEICGTVADRLAAIEDILGDDYDLDRLKELVEAERKKRVIIAPDSIKTMSDINRLELKIRTKDWVSVTFRYENCAIGVAEALKQLGFILDAEDALKGEQDG